VPEQPRAVQVAAQAKINLRLRILAREASGYHQIETLFHRIALADVVRVRRTSAARSLDMTGDVDMAALGPTERNLAWRAAESYCSASAMSGGFAIELEKRIPIGGGLGGGSADAGAVLRALDAMAEHPLGEARLIRLAAALGSDVPFLASEHAFALAWGRGERMLALTPPTTRDVRLLLPPFPVNTADAYGWLAEDRAGADVAADALVLHPPQLEGWDSLAHIAVNDFEPVVARRHPAIASALATQRADASVELAMLSGSGSSMFAIGRSDAVLGAARAKDDVGTRLVMTRTILRVEPPLRIE
jgi:4-diphosphocytidyl-2-C-methyl-D-erythritol kinase